LNAGSASAIAVDDYCVEKTQPIAPSCDFTTAMYVQKEGALRAWKIQDDAYPMEGGPNSPTNPLNDWAMSVTDPALTGTTGAGGEPAGRTTMKSYDIKVGDGTNQYEICEELQTGWVNHYACRGTCGQYEQYPTTLSGNLVCMTIGLSKTANPDFTVFFGNEPLPCAILGDDLVRIGDGSNIAADPSGVCSNGTLHTGAKVSVDTSLLARGDMTLGGGTAVGQDAFSNGSLSTGAKVSIGFDDALGDLDVDAGGDLSLGSGTQVEGECQYAGTLHTGTAAACGTVTPGATLPLPDPFVLPGCAVTPPQPYSPAIKTPAGSTAYYDTPLQPGNYGTVSFGTGNQVAIEAGEYYFQSLKFGTNTEVEIRGPITVHVVDALRFANGVQEVLVGGVLPSEIIYLVDGATAVDPEYHSGASTVLFGTFCGPDSTISFGNGTELTGAIIGKEVGLGAKVNFTADPAPSIFAN
jgi:hypothetical protein